MLFKILKGLVQAIPSSDYLIPFKEKRKIKDILYHLGIVNPKTFTNQKRLHNNCFTPIVGLSNIYTYELFFSVESAKREINCQYDS